MSTQQSSASASAYAAFWLYQRRDSWRCQTDAELVAAEREFLAHLDGTGDEVTLRGVYTSLGLSSSIDLIVWAHSPELAPLQSFAIAFDRTAAGRHLVARQNYMGFGGMSTYDPSHGPAFVKGIAPKRYLSVYPFTKTPDWYLLDFQERRRLMIEHGEMGREFPEILTNTVNSFGIQDQEFVVALEDNDPNQIIRMVQRLRAAEVRKWTGLDTPIYLGDRKTPAEVFADLRGR